MVVLQVQVQVQITLFVPNGAIRFAADSIVQRLIQRFPTLQAWLQIIKNSKQSINSKSLSYLWFFIELRSRMAAGTK